MRRAAAHQHTPIHGGQLLSLIHHDMPVRPFAIVGRTLGGVFGGAAVDVVQQHLRGDDAVADAVLGKRILGELDLLVMFRLEALAACLHLRVLAQQLHRLVQQGDVGTGQRRALLAGQRLHLLVAEPRGVATQLMRLGEHVVKHPLRGHRQPSQIQRHTNLVVHAQQRDRAIQLILVWRVVQLLLVPHAHGGQHGFDKGLTRLVMRLMSALGVAERLLDVGRQHGDVDAVDVHDRQIRGNALAVGHRVANRCHHTPVALDIGDLRRIHGGGDHAGNQIGDGTAHHTRLAKRRQYLIDVMQEGRARADDKHTGSGKRAAVRVQQVCGAMQCDGGLAGARAALHHYGTIERRTDDRVLLALNRGDDIGHLAGTTGTERSQQGALAGKCSGGGGLVDGL